MSNSKMVLNQVPRNVLGKSLIPCSYDPLTGYLRDDC